MKYEVTLRYHQDDSTGTWGLAPTKTINNSTSFNAFWGADGIFHDVFEHYFEGNHKYYTGNGFMTLWGEMCASGHGIAYKNIGIDNFRYRKHRQQRDFKADTVGYVYEAIYEMGQYPDERPYTEFDMSKETCRAPYKNPKSYNDYNLESTISEYLCTVEDYCEKYGTENPLWMPGVARNYVHGFKTAEKIIGSDVKHSYTVLDDFLSTWNTVSKLDPHYLFINGSDYGLKSINFKVSNFGKLKVKTTLIDDLDNKFPLDCLSN